MNVGAIYTSYKTGYTVRVGELGQPSTITEEITIKKNDDTPITPDREWDAIVQESGHIPEINGAYFGTVPAGATWEQFLRCRSHAWRSGPRGILIVSVEYSTLYMLDPGQENTTYALPSSVDYSSRARSVTMYRTSWTVAPPTGATNITADIGGNAIGGGFVGKPDQVNQVAIRVRTTLDASAEDMSTIYANRYSIVGKRNTDAVGGFPAYSLVCEGVSAAKTGSGFEFYEVIFDLVWDRWYHFEQVPTIAEAGLPKQNSSFGPEEVKWQRLELPTAAFLPVMFPADPGPGTDTVWANRTLKGWWL